MITMWLPFTLSLERENEKGITNIFIADGPSSPIHPCSIHVTKPHPLPLMFDSSYVMLYRSAISTHCLSCCTTEMAVLASNPVVGSSRNSTCGSMISSIPILVLFLSPPDTPRINSFPIYIHQYSINQCWASR